MLWLLRASCYSLEIAYFDNVHTRSAIDIVAVHRNVCVHVSTMKLPCSGDGSFSYIVGQEGSYGFYRIERITHCESMS